jgi:hypothetical protein
VPIQDGALRCAATPKRIKQISPQAKSCILMTNKHGMIAVSGEILHIDDKQTWNDCRVRRNPAY